VQSVGCLRAGVQAGRVRGGTHVRGTSMDWQRLGRVGRRPGGGDGD
jgi:hypothetical protein